MNKRVAETERGHMYVILLYGKNTLVKGDYAIEEKVTSKIICGLYYLNKVASVTKEK